MAEELCVLQLHAVVEVLEQDGGETSRSAAGHRLRPFKAPRAPHHVEPVLKSVLLGFSAMFGVRCGDLSFWCSRDCEVCVSLSPPPRAPPHSPVRHTRSFIDGVAAVSTQTMRDGFGVVASTSVA